MAAGLSTGLDRVELDRAGEFAGALVAARSSLTAQGLLARVRPASWSWQTGGARA